jgi:hypothetical protein
LPASPRRIEQIPVILQSEAVVTADWVSASRTRNFCQSDPLLDWLDLYGRQTGFHRDDELPGYDPQTDFGRFITSRGQGFEAAVLRHLATLYPVSVVATDRRNVRSAEKAQQTFAEMLLGRPLVAQAVLHDPEHKTFGSADLLVRSDVLRRLFSDIISEDEAALAAPNLEGQPWHYRVIDIKFSTLQLSKDGHAAKGHLAYMAQAFIYNAALGLLQGYEPPSSYLLGRGWLQQNERGTSCMGRLARVDQAHMHSRGKVALSDTVTAATGWVRRLRTEGAGWTPIPDPSVNELRPNMGNTDDQPWHHAKRRIGHQLADLTLLWQVGVDARNRANAEGIFRWTEPGCTVAALRVRGSTTQVVLEKILTVNQTLDEPPVRPARVASGRDVWWPDAPLEFYVDFETVTNLADDFALIPEQNGQPLIAMIGCGHVENGLWRFACFIVDDLTELSETAAIEAWLAHMAEVRERVAPTADPIIYHWSPAETSSFENAYNSAKVRHPENDWPELCWFDFLKKVIKAEPVVVRGALAFGLKAMASALHEHGLIDTVWSDGPADGLGAMAGIWSCADEAAASGCNLRDIPLMQAIASYNEVDCKAMMEIIRYLRAAH